MAYKNLVSFSLAVVFLLICCGSFFFGFAASQNTDGLSGDQETSAQYYRPYYNNNRRPAYPVRRPAYNYINQRPQIPVTSNYRPSAATVAQPNNRPSTSGTGTCSTNTYQQYGICWAADSQRLQISPNLTIENLVRFHTYNLFGPLVYSTSYRKQLCDQSRRFNSVGLICITTGEDDCISSRGTAAALSCINDDCICVVGEPYETISSKTDSPSSPFNAALFQPGFGPSWTAGFNQHIQNTLAAHGIYWRP